MNLQGNRDPLGIAGTMIAEKYKVSHAVGEGGFSVVYKAEHTIWRQPVALKCFKVLANAPPDQRDVLLNGFIQEGRLMAELSSRSAAIVQARDVGTFTTPDGQWLPYMVLEWLEGKPLDAVLWQEERADMPPRSLHEAMALLEPAAVALEIVHARNIAHRDIKPANIFVLGDARELGAHVKVLDFGIAKVMAEHMAVATALAHTGQDITSFTPNYGAPEQFSRSHGATGPWTDVFAMALILVEMMAGRAALQGDDYLQLALVSRDPMRRPTPRALGCEVSTAIEAVFTRALAVVPGERFSTMGRFWAALHQAVFPDSPMWNMGTSSSRLSAVPSGGGASSTGQSSYSARTPSAQSMSGPGQSGPYSIPGSSPNGPYGPHGPGQNGPYSPHGPGQRDRYSPHGSGQSGPYSPPGPGSSGRFSGHSDTTHAASLPTTLARPAKGSRVLLAVGIAAVIALVGGGFAAFKMLGAGDAPPHAAAVPPTTPTAAPTAAPNASAAPARLTECPQGMALVAGGKFFMGSDEATFKLWQPAHKVTIDTFCIDVHEVTAGEYKACSDKGECKRPPEVPDYPKADSVSDADHEKTKATLAELCTFGKDGLGRHPINCVSWSFAEAYCEVQKKRLPTEAEWEYAARGSDGRKFPWGDQPGDHTFMNACGKECTAWEAARGLKLSPRMYDADDGFSGTAPVGSFPKGKTKFGAEDVVGNVWEWTGDWFETYKPDEAVNPKGAPAGERKAIRGGGYNGGFALWVNPAFRYHQLATASAPGIGFRCARLL